MLQYEMFLFLPSPWKWFCFMCTLAAWVLSRKSCISEAGSIPCDSLACVLMRGGLTTGICRFSPSGGRLCVEFWGVITPTLILERMFGTFICILEVDRFEVALGIGVVTGSDQII
ncbi:Hypothetical_protein [Hexamita inflata]|uniref:Hypothetical_protein n=1 Tax=Hexamita inflata TaxID=28002 RepID=A0AA86UJB6_9EUKA|nr:Hypothetical protein HINF_LOCUS41409 [Hexamita inflata]CAI9953771.1 Hypothetical protein HINF_LOCUS41416 [Hexamita inflata]